MALIPWYLVSKGTSKGDFFRPLVRFVVLFFTVSPPLPMPACCSCNGRKAVCKRCVCARSGRLCVSCLPLKEHRCANTPRATTATNGPDDGVVRVDLDTPSRDDRPTLSPGFSRYDDSVSDISKSCVHNLSDSNVCFDDLMHKAYGASLVQSADDSVDSVWYCRWTQLVHHVGNHYLLPGGSIGRKYIDVLTEEISHLAAGNYPSERVLVFSSVMLQRDRMVRKGADIRRLLDRRIKLWRQESYDLLLQEAARCNQALLRRRHSPIDEEATVRVFTKLMLRGKVKAAVRWATERSQGVVLSPENAVEGLCGATVMDVLRQKHPSPQPPVSASLIHQDQLPLFEDVEITGTHILRSAHRIQGGAGPGGCDACHWCDALLRYGAYSERLRDAVAALARRMANTIVPWADIRALVSNRLIALDKCPGVRPIGIGESLRRIVGKAVCSATRSDLTVLSGTDQLCCGVKSGIEGAVHAITSLFEEHCDSPSGWGVLLVDASNAFNSLNRNALFWNVRVLWPRCSRFFFNTYRGWAPLIVRGTDEFLFSREGVTQGDPLSMFLYAVGTLPLIQSLKNPSAWTQVWYADDASACGELTSIRRWFDLLLQQGPSYGYFPNATKSYVVVHPSSVAFAKSVFGSLGVHVVTSHRFLGGFLGDVPARNSFVQAKVDQWVSDVHHLSRLAVPQPQAAYAALTKSLQCEWIYIQRVIPDCHILFAPLENAIFSSFLPAMFGCEISQLEFELFSLPVRLGGLGICLPKYMAQPLYNTSRQATCAIVDSIRNIHCFELDIHDDAIVSAHKGYKRICDSLFDDLFATVSSSLDSLHLRALHRARINDLSGWLTVLPLEKDNFDLTAQEFRDALAVRYRKPLLNIPPFCDGCGSASSLDHFLICKKGGLITQRHNEIRDAVGDLASLVWGSVKREPVVKDTSDDDSGETLIADLCVRGVWLPQTEALFDIRVIDTDAQSYLSQPPSSVLFAAETEKKRKYLDASTARRAHFTPLCFSVDGLVGVEAASFLKRLAFCLCARWERSHADVISWIRTRLAFAILRATVLCVRGSHTRWHCLGLEDGASIDFT